MMMKCFQCASSSPNFSFALVPEQLGWPTNLWPTNKTGEWIFLRMETRLELSLSLPTFFETDFPVLVSDAVMLHPKINLISKLVLLGAVWYSIGFNFSKS
ncbi:hypothetical protein KFK09_010687 [Dendrobium nobile]|uniref:Uncharacterized protein n=1 Tax=Dendrobium nobile TaxID=94219 RepID=A0A8T3BCR3_DENNO|nr:hypothetical protein KFK09_010687 [Dendrobium nobile]